MCANPNSSGLINVFCKLSALFLLETGLIIAFQAARERLFCDFCLDEHVHGDHLLRRIDES
jgi:hypothetical protein